MVEGDLGQRAVLALEVDPTVANADCVQLAPKYDGRCQRGPGRTPSPEEAQTPLIDQPIRLAQRTGQQASAIRGVPAKLGQCRFCLRHPRPIRTGKMRQ